MVTPFLCQFRPFEAVNQVIMYKFWFRNAVNSSTIRLRPYSENNPSRPDR
jgi:hypothetical protein